MFFLLLVCLSTTLFLATSGEFISTNYDTYNKGVLGHRPHHKYYSSSERAPVLHVSTWNKTATETAGGTGSSSHIFLRNDGQNETEKATPLVLAARDLSAVYMNRTFDNVFGTRVQEDRGRRYLTFWAGDKGNGIGSGYGLAYDAQYNLRYNISTRGMRTHADLHEFAFTGTGTALVTGVDRVRVSTEGWVGWRGAKNYTILDGVFQEIDLDTNELLFSWRATDHIHPMESYETIANDWDTYHINSIQKTEAGNYLISIRHTHTIHLISGTTGAILWTLGGKHNDFAEPNPPLYPSAPVLSFAWQHHARFVPGTNETQLTLFDNHVKTTTHGTCRSSTCSRGLHIAINTTTTTPEKPTVHFLNEYLHPAHLQAQSQGSMQILDDADNPATTPSFARVLVGWGRCPSITEHDAVTGETLMDVQFSPWHSDAIPDALDNYRAYRMDWVAEPWWDPVMALRAGEEEEGSGLDVYLSWNGATEVRGWAVRGIRQNGSMVEELSSGRSRHEGAPVLAWSERTGFETRLHVSRGALARGDDGEEGQLLYLWAEALDADGNVLRETDVVDFTPDGWNATILPFTGKDFEERLAETMAAAGRHIWLWVFVSTGVVVGLAVVIGGVRVLLRNYWAYDRLDDEDFYMDGDDSDVDEEYVPLGVDFLRDDEVREPWRDFTMYVSKPDSGPRPGASAYKRE